jgi:hypothetical protein
MEEGCRGGVAYPKMVVRKNCHQICIKKNKNQKRHLKFAELKTHFNDKSEKSKGSLLLLKTFTLLALLLLMIPTNRPTPRMP